MTAFLTDSLNAARPAKGDPDDEFAPQMRETARHPVEQCLDHIESMIRIGPRKLMPCGKQRFAKTM